MPNRVRSRLCISEKKVTDEIRDLQSQSRKWKWWAAWPELKRPDSVRQLFSFSCFFFCFFLFESNSDLAPLQIDFLFNAEGVCHRFRLQSNLHNYSIFWRSNRFSNKSCICIRTCASAQAHHVPHGTESEVSTKMTANRGLTRFALIRCIAEQNVSLVRLFLSTASWFAVAVWTGVARVRCERTGFALTFKSNLDSAPFGRTVCIIFRFWIGGESVSYDEVRLNGAVWQIRRV